MAASMCSVVGGAGGVSTAIAAVPRASVNAKESVWMKAGSVSKAFGLRVGESRVTCMATYKIKLKTPKGVEVFEASDDTYLLDSAELAGVDLPYSCRAGACSSCAGMIVEGTVDQADGSFLDENHIEQGFLLTCVSYPTSDLVIETHKEELL